MAHRLDITRRLHEQLLEIVRTALPLIPAAVADADLAGLAYLRHEMIATIDRYRVHVADLRAAAARSGDQHAHLYAELLSAGCASLDAAYEAFRARWAQRQAMENWHEYRLSAIVMMKQVRSCVQQAEQLRNDYPPLAA